MEYELICEQGHTITLSPTKLQAFLEEGDLSCNECGDPLELDSPLSLYCQICDCPWDVSTLQEAAAAAADTCRHCEEFARDAYFYVPGCHQENVAQYEFTTDGADGSSLARKGRHDYWEGLIHFCTREQFVSIFRTGKIVASPTGFFGLPAVCLTETPASECVELKAAHGEYGYVFRKGQLILEGANPAVYLQGDLLRSIRNAPGAEALHPFVNLLRTRQSEPGKKRYDYLHEREWRVPGDVDLEKTPPLGVILPDVHRSLKFGGSDGEAVLAAAQSLGELR
jgi:hypothetical protein